jgi:hypothetical protein
MEMANKAEMEKFISEERLIEINQWRGVHLPEWVVAAV